jgi:hypothetical protein
LTQALQSVWGHHFGAIRDYANAAQVVPFNGTAKQEEIHERWRDGKDLDLVALDGAANLIG